MSKARLADIDRELHSLSNLTSDLEALKLKGGNIKPVEITRAAEKLGFSSKKRKRTGEQTWIGPFGYTIAVSSHPKTYGKGLGIKILKVLIDVAERMIEALEDEKERLTKKISQPFWNDYS